jgi:hypothetical protein
VSIDDNVQGRASGIITGISEISGSPPVGRDLIHMLKNSKSFAVIFVPVLFT